MLGQRLGPHVLLNLKPMAERKTRADQVIAAAAKTSNVVRREPDPAIGSGSPHRRSTPAVQFQYTLRSDNLRTSTIGRRRLLEGHAQIPDVADVISDQLNRGLQVAAHDRPRGRDADSAFLAANRGSTPRSTTRSDNGKCRRCTRRSTNSASSWEVDPEFRQNTDGLTYLYVAA